MFNWQRQKAGDNANQQQAGTIINVGIDEKRAREIYQEMNLQVRKEYTQEALETANTRISEFENRLLPKMETVNGAFEAFADPSFQLLLVEAQKTAASTERSADYDLLSELLIHRFVKGENRVIRAGISRAVEIVDEISDDALLGITVFHSVSYFFPITGNIQEGLNVLDDLFGKLFYANLPAGLEWLDHLDILDAVRLNSFGGLKKLDVYYSEILSGYINVGIEKESNDYVTAINILNENSIPLVVFAEHELNQNFMRLVISDPTQIDSLTFQRQITKGANIQLVSFGLNEVQKAALQEIYHLYKKDENIKRENLRVFMEELDKRKNLKILKEWWNNLGTNIKLTSVGRVLAHANAQRCDKNLPPLN